jgi:sugar-specific transcriptional regulator TrmB/DNA-binding CsgD family transcriptional regulator
MLTALGLSEREDSVYRYLVGSMPATVEEVEEGTGLGRADIAEALARLEELGFAQRMGDGSARFAAASPWTVDAAIHSRLADLRRAQESLGQLAARYRARYLATEYAGVFEVIRGADALRERTIDIVASARSEALNMVKPPIIAVHSAEGVEPDPAVRGRVVFDRDAVADARTLDAIRTRPGAHLEIRVHTMVPVKMIVIDRSMALVPLVQRDQRDQRDDVPVGVLFSEGALLDSFLALFDYVWETAVGFHVHDGGARGNAPLSQADQQLLSLLLAGLTDQAIAAHFRISVRTVERKVRALMDAAHVRTRMQLAWEAARQQWL